MQKTSFAHYFLVVWDIVSFARRQKIPCGVRGSAAASLVLYCLGITDVDPLEHKLVFERFLNIERKEMPDIDLDFQDDRRDEVIAYVAQKYGQDHVAQIITFGTLGARAAMRDVGRALGMPYGEVDQVARLVPFGVGMTLDKAIEENEELRRMYEEDAIVRNLVDSAKHLEGVSRHASTHAAGVVISRDPLTEHVPLQQVSKARRQGHGHDPVRHGGHRQDRPAEDGLPGADQPDHPGRAPGRSSPSTGASSSTCSSCPWTTPRPSSCCRPGRPAASSSWKARGCAATSRS